MTAAFVVALLCLALGLSLWAPWRDDSGVGLSGYPPRAEAGPAPSSSSPVMEATAAALPAPTTVPQPAAVAVGGERPGEVVRPRGMPLLRVDWQIVRDYGAHGGPGPRGAIDIGIIGNREALGTPIYATHDGTVRLLRNNATYGNLVAIKNGRWSTTYGHLEQVMVSDGQAVRRGEQVGTLGSSGNAPAPQLNYQVWETVGAEELNRNPMDYLNER